MTNEFIKINSILKEWNPIGVPESALNDEYVRYIKDIYKIRKNKVELVKYLENLLINVMGLDYNPKSKIQKKDLNYFAERISEI